MTAQFPPNTHLRAAPRTWLLFSFICSRFGSMQVSRSLEKLKRKEAKKDKAPSLSETRPSQSPISELPTGGICAPGLGKGLGSSSFLFLALVSCTEGLGRKRAPPD